ncbi:MULTISPECIES: 4'-phosphopantetheinyl transferase family protein [unclassified Streptomyces]|uniref:4'-phosphopantetheinyl transferase family protein n=1 Tax=unclassified Streptomyces TaxID=2593676 RepID=UPI0036E60B3F
MDSCDQVEIWTIELNPAGIDAREFTELLSDTERNRWNHIADQRDRRRYAVAHGATRLILADRLDVPPRSLTWRRGSHGKPHLVGFSDCVHTSLTHSGELALLAVAGREVGVDAERMAARWSTAPPARLFPAAEAAAVAAAPPAERAAMFVRLLTRKEACVKAGGGALLPHGIRLSTAGGSPLVVTSPFQERWCVRDVPVAEGYGASVALTGPEDFEVRLRHWSPPGPARQGTA